MPQPSNEERRPSSGRVLRWVLPALAVLLIAVASCWWLFRTETVDNSSLGLISYHFRWGRLTGLSVDSNRDGLTDGKMTIVSFDNQVGSTNFDVVEGWESSKLDGQFDIHYWKDETSGEFFLERDLNGDHVFETRSSGHEAEAEFRTIQRGH